MKKIICLLISILLVISFSVTGYSEQALAGSSYSFMPDVDGKPKVMLYNDYYKLYYNDIFEAEFANLKYYNMSGMTEKTLEPLTDNNYIYAAVILTDDETQDYLKYNNSVLTSVFEATDILYVGETTPISVVKLTKENAEKLLNVQQVEGIFPAFYSSSIFDDGLSGIRTLGDVTDTPDVTSADARYLLRFSTGLETVNKSSAKKFYLCGDMNSDGKINSADARIALRTAAKLEKKVTIAFDSSVEWDDFRNF